VLRSMWNHFPILPEGISISIITHMVLATVYRHMTIPTMPTPMRRDESPPTRRLALVTYFHEEWQPDWGGELILYTETDGLKGKKNLEVAQCIAPSPGSLAIFAVPRFHRVCRVDPLARDHKRLSIAGWFMTEH